MRRRDDCSCWAGGRGARAPLLHCVWFAGAHTHVSPGGFAWFFFSALKIGGIFVDGYAEKDCAVLFFAAHRRAHCTHATTLLFLHRLYALFCLLLRTAYHLLRGGVALNGMDVLPLWRCVDEGALHQFLRRLCLAAPRRISSLGCARLTVLTYTQRIFSAYTY